MKNKLSFLTTSLLLFVLVILTSSLVVTFMQDISNGAKYALIALLIILSSTNFISIITASIVIRKRRMKVNNSLDAFVEESVSRVGVGVLIINKSLDIIWASKFIEDRLNKNIVGKKINTISEGFQERFSEGETRFSFEAAGSVFRAHIDFPSNTVVLKDITNEDMVMKQYVSGKGVIAELEIDNFQQLQTILPEEELFKVQSAIIGMLDSLVEKHNIIYRQYVNGKFILFTNQETLDIFISERFKFFDTIRSIDAADGIKLSASMGVGAGSAQIKELIDLAKDGLMQALARGGDQAAVMRPNFKPEYFGSKNEVVKSSSRVKIKQVSKMLEEKLKSEQIKKVIIYGHIYADLDAVGSALGVASLAKTMKKDVYIQNQTFDTTTQLAISELLTKDDQDIFISKSKANRLTTKKDTVVIIVDTAELHRIENDKALINVKKENVFVFDHHRVSILPDNILSTNSYIDTSSSSASEIVTEVLQFVSVSVKPPKSTAQMLLNGIYLDTKQFTKSVSSKTFTAASYLERFGASSSASSELLKLPEEYSQLVTDIFSNLKEVKPGYFISTYMGEVPQDIISLASDELLRVKGRKAVFVIAKVPGRKEFKMSARGNETNVQVIAEAVGGGGHFGAAAAVSKEPISIFEDNVIQSIISMKGDK